MAPGVKPSAGVSVDLCSVVVMIPWLKDKRHRSPRSRCAADALSAPLDAWPTGVLGNKRVTGNREAMNERGNLRECIAPFLERNATAAVDWFVEQRSKRGGGTSRIRNSGHAKAG